MIINTDRRHAAALIDEERRRDPNGVGFCVNNNCTNPPVAYIGWYRRVGLAAPDVYDCEVSAVALVCERHRTASAVPLP